MSKISDLHAVLRPASPNTCLSVPEGYRTASLADAVSPVFDLSAKELADHAVRLWSEEARVSLAERSSDDLQAHFIATTALMRFKDDIHCEFVDLGDGKSSVAIYSASRVGYSDLGTNRKRVEHWLNILREAIKGA